MKAGMRFIDEPLKDVFIDIDQIFFKRHDEEHIKPKDINDFDRKHLYGVYCCYCHDNECTDSTLCKYYKGYIFGLGENKEEILKKHNESGKRIGFKNKKIIEDTTDTDNEVESQKIKKSMKREAKNITKKVWKTNTERTLDKYKLMNFIKCRRKLNEDFVDKISQEIEESAKESTGSNLSQKLSHNNDVQHLENNNNDHYSRNEDGHDKNNNNEDQHFEVNNDDHYFRNEAENDASDNDGELAHQLQDASDDSSDDEPHNVEELTNADDWSYIKVYKYKLFKYLKKFWPERNRNYKALENEPEIYSENYNMKYLGLGINIGSLTWTIVKNKKDDLFLREIALLIWPKKKLANRCLKLARVQNNIPERSPVKLVTPQKLIHFLKLYRDYLMNKKSPEDKIKWYIGKSTLTLSFLIRDLRQKAIEKANRRISRK